MSKRLYVFLNRRICDIDGSIQYIYNKKNYLERHDDYNVIVFSTAQGRILVEEFKEYQKYIVAEMRFCPSIFRSSERKAILSKIISLIPCGYEEIIIESTSPVSAIWGELIASKLRCRHIYFHLMEKTDFRDDLREFCWFKYKRNEIAGITSDTIPMILKDRNICPNTISAYCNNVVFDCADFFSEKLDENASYTIGSIGRLEKPYVPIMFQNIVDYCKSHQDFKYNVVMIGGSAQSAVADNMRAIAENCFNMTLLITDYIYPIPEKLINNIDLFVSTAGSAYTTYSLYKPTIKVNPLNGQVIGIMGCDFMPEEKTMYESSSEINIADCIERIINGKAKIRYEIDNYDQRMEEEFARQLKMVDGEVVMEYFDTTSLVKIKTPYKKYHTAYTVACHILGGKLFLKLVNIISGI